MKKTSVLFACALPILLASCYSTPEFNETPVKHCKYKTTMGCDPENFYQNAAFRDCVEETAYIKQKNKKTVVFGEMASGESLVIPKAVGMEEMSDPNMVYPVVDVRKTAENAEVVIMNTSATQEDMAIQETTIVETEKTKTTTTTEERVTTALSGERLPIEAATAEELNGLPETGDPNQASSFNVEVSVEEEVTQTDVEPLSETSNEPVQLEQTETVEEIVVGEPVPALETELINNEKEVLPLEEK